jgi:DNA-3-methyladenine glycosylase I
VVHFSEFDPEKVTRYSENRIEKLTLNPAIIRNRMNIKAAVRNAQAFLAIREELGSFDAYCWRFVDGRPKLNRWKAMREIPATSLIPGFQVQSQSMAKGQRVKVGQS